MSEASLLRERCTCGGKHILRCVAAGRDCPDEHLAHESDPGDEQPDEDTT